MAVGVQRLAPAALPAGNTRYPLYRRLDGPHGRSGRVRNTSPPTGSRSPDRPARNLLLDRLCSLGPLSEYTVFKTSATDSQNSAIEGNPVALLWKRNYSNGLRFKANENAFKLDLICISKLHLLQNFMFC